MVPNAASRHEFPNARRNPRRRNCRLTDGSKATHRTKPLGPPLCRASFTARSHCWGRWRPADLFLGQHQLIGETLGEWLAWPFRWWRRDSTLRNSVLPNPLARAELLLLVTLTIPQHRQSPTREFQPSNVHSCLNRRMQWAEEEKVQRKRSAPAFFVSQDG
jgi:hypothetical protein